MGLKQLGLDSDDYAKIGYLIHKPHGLFLATGPIGCGKTTTLYAALNEINILTESIVTIEDPIEYELPGINQVQVDYKINRTFANTLRAVLRQDVDTLLVGEIRDFETAQIASGAAVTGHLVFSTLHTPNASQSIERAIDIYPAYQQTQARTMLANALQAVVSQTLFRRIDEPGMVPSTEILLCTSAVRNCIRENRIYEIPNIIETSRRFGMHTMDNSIAELCLTGYIDKEEAILRSSNRAKMEKALQLAREH